MKRGHPTPFAKLSEPIVAEIKHHLRMGALPKNLAMDYGVKIKAIYRIRSKQAWYWVKPLEPTRQGAFVPGATEPGASVLNGSKAI